MPTNQEWLHKLANESPDELNAWFNAEHVDAQQDNNGTCPIGNGTRPNTCNNSGENVTDSREKLEADIRASLGFTTKDVFAWLDRQDRITYLEYMASCNSCAYRVEHGELQEQVDNLNDKRNLLHRRNSELRIQYDKLKRERDNLAADLITCNREREQLRKHLGIALDHAHDICSLVDIDGNVLDVGD